MHPPTLPLAAAAALIALGTVASSSSLAAHPRTGFLQDVLSSRSAEQNYCKPTGQIHDACCDYETVESVNEELFGRLHDLVATPYFRYHKVDLAKECPYWEEDGSCMNRACSVETTGEDHIPEAWRSSALGKLNETSAWKTSSPAGCTEISDSDFCVLEDELDSEGVYVDLLENPERFTGYAGPSSSRVWKAIYEENCFTPVPFVDASRSTFEGGSGFAPVSSGFGGLASGMGGMGGMGGGLAAGGWGESEKRLLGSLAGPRDPDEEVCLEKRVFYRVISGLHASISVHICDDYLDQQTGEWAPNLDCFITRIGQHPERLENMYFTYVLLLRALSRSGPQLVRTLDATAGERETRDRLEQLVRVADGCPSTFDETSMFSGGKEAELLKSEFKDHFRNVSRIMDCVGCDKCRLWGKMQITGLGTALKLLFSYDGATPLASPTDDPTAAPHAVALSRSELVAFVNTLHRLSESLAAVDRFRTLWAHRGEPAPPPARSPAPPSSSPAPSPVAAAPREDQVGPDEPLNSAPPAAPSTHKPSFEPSVGVGAGVGVEGNTSTASLWERLVGLCEGGWSACVRVVAASAARVKGGEPDGSGRDEL
ncbi:hypothetical protein JCM3775_006447 [Rhodotorula graminis]